MRALLIGIVLLSTASAAAAQSHTGRWDDEVPMPSIGLPLPHIGLPLPTIGLPLPPMGLPPRVEPQERSNASERPQRRERFERPASIVFYGWPYLPPAEVPAPPIPAAPLLQPTGRLHLSLRSGVDPQIFVDGYYTGLFSDVAGELTVDAGAHVLELREDGFDNLRLNVKIPLDQAITYAVELTPIGSVSSAAPIPAVVPEPSPTPSPSTIFMVPGCYVGNVPPQQVRLPAGCDASNAVIFPSR